MVTRDIETYELSAFQQMRADDAGKPIKWADGSTRLRSVYVLTGAINTNWRTEVNAERKPIMSDQTDFVMKKLAEMDEAKALRLEREADVAEGKTPEYDASEYLELLRKRGGNA